MSQTPKKFDNQGIVTYYHRTNWFYKRFWNLDQSMGMHFGFWNQSTKNLQEAVIHQNEWMANLLNIQREYKILDAGCGVGGSSIYIAKHYGCNVTGITITPKQIISAKEYAKKEGVENKVEFLEMDFTSTTFKDASFDVVWAIESVCHAADKKEFIKEAFRLLKPGGRLIVADYFPTKNEYTNDEYKLVYTDGINGWAVSELCNEKEFAQFSHTIGFKKHQFHNMNKEVEPTANIILNKKQWLPLAWVYYKLGFITDTEYHNAFGSYNFSKAFKSSLWNYMVFVAEK